MFSFSLYSGAGGDDEPESIILVGRGSGQKKKEAEASSKSYSKSLKLSCHKLKAKDCMTMDNMITVTDTYFKDLEEKCFRSACTAAQAEMTRVLEQLDRQLMENRDKTQYRHKGLRETTVKTIFGEVTFKRTLYKTKDNDFSLISRRFAWIYCTTAYGRMVLFSPIFSRFHRIF